MCSQLPIILLAGCKMAGWQETCSHTHAMCKKCTVKYHANCVKKCKIVRYFSQSAGWLDDKESFTVTGHMQWVFISCMKCKSGAKKYNTSPRVQDGWMTRNVLQPLVICNRFSYHALSAKVVQTSLILHPGCKMAGWQGTDTTCSLTPALSSRVGVLIHTKSNLCPWVC